MYNGTMVAVIHMATTIHVATKVSNGWPHEPRYLSKLCWILHSLCFLRSPFLKASLPELSDIEWAYDNSTHPPHILKSIEKLWLNYFEKNPYLNNLDIFNKKYKNQ